MHFQTCLIECDMGTVNVAERSMQCCMFRLAQNQAGWRQLIAAVHTWLGLLSLSGVQVKWINERTNKRLKESKKARQNKWTDKQTDIYVWGTLRCCLQQSNWHSMTCSMCANNKHALLPNMWLLIQLPVSYIFFSSSHFALWSSIICSTHARAFGLFRTVLDFILQTQHMTIQYLMQNICFVPQQQVTIWLEMLAWNPATRHSTAPIYHHMDYMNMDWMNRQTKGWT